MDRKSQLLYCPLDDFNMVLGMEFFNQIHLFPLLATNSCMFSLSASKLQRIHFRPCNSKRFFQKDPRFFVFIKELKEEENYRNLPSQVPSLIHEILNEFKDVMPQKLSKNLSLKQEINHEIELEQGIKPPALVTYRMMLRKLEELQTRLKNLLNVSPRLYLVHQSSSKRKMMDLFKCTSTIESSTIPKLRTINRSPW